VGGASTTKGNSLSKLYFAFFLPNKKGKTYFSSGITSRCQVCLRIYKFQVDDFTTSSQVVDQLERQGKEKKGIWHETNEYWLQSLWNFMEEKRLPKNKFVEILLAKRRIWPTVE
jgi:hypothetical protein